MTTKRWHRVLCGVIGVLLSSIVVAATPRPLTDSQLDAVYAAGFDVRVDLGLDVSGSNPNGILIDGGDASAVSQLMSSGLTIARSTVGSRNSSSFDPSGAYMPNLQNLTVNNIDVSGLKNATTLMNIFALDGDVAVGLNLNVIVNPINSNFVTNQTNSNWGILNLSSDAYSTLIPSN